MNSVENVIDKIINECDIYYDNKCISKETMLRAYMEFFKKCINPSEKRTSFSLNTGSICYDVISIVIAVICSLAFSDSSNEDILSELREGDMVIYKNQRYRWKGFDDSNGMRMICLEQDGNKNTGKGTTLLPFDRFKHQVKPYHGDSKVTDGRGIRKTKSNRGKFLSFIYDIPEKEVPSSIDTSVVVVADREEATKIFENVRIKYTGSEEKISLNELVAATYYTSSGEEIPIGKNPTKKEPVLKITGKVSEARDLVLDKTGNRVIGLVTTNSANIPNDDSELQDLMNRKTLKVYHYMTRYNSDFGQRIVKDYEKALVFAVSPTFLRECNYSLVEKNTYTEKLYVENDNFARLKVSNVDVINGLSWDEITQVQAILYDIKNSILEDELKEQFIINASAVINLITYAPFKLKLMEEVIGNHILHVGVITPFIRLERLREISINMGGVSKKAIELIDILENKCKGLYESNPKANALGDVIRQNIRKKIAVIVPKAYYIDILRQSNIFGIKLSNISIMTANRFNPDSHFEHIIVVGNFVGKKFNIFDSNSSPEVSVLLYDSEQKPFRFRKKQIAKYEKNITAKHKKYTYKIAQEVPKEEIDELEELEAFNKLNEYIEGFKYIDVGRLSKYGNYDGTTPMSEVNYIGLFSTGDQILFSKYYNAVIYDSGKNNVTEQEVSKLNPGDILVFTMKNDYTRNIVDEIFDELLSNNKLPKQVIEAYPKSLRWKEVLRKYRDANELTYQELASKLKINGGKYDAVTVRQWIAEGSHIVGPRNINTLELIGKTCNDDELKNNREVYFNSIKLVRKHRTKILKLIAEAIKEKLSGHHVDDNGLIDVVYRNVDKLSETYELEEIRQLDEPVNVQTSIVNRPMSREELEL